MPNSLKGVHPLALLLVAAAIFLMGLFGQGRGLFVKILWLVAAAVAVFGALNEWLFKK